MPPSPQSSAIRGFMFGHSSSPKVARLPAEEVKRRIQGCQVTNLSLNNFLLTSAMMPAIVEAINKNDKITEVDLSHNSLDSDAIPDLIKLERVRRLDLSHNNINSDNLELLITSDRLIYVDLCDNDIDEVGQLLLTAASKGRIAYSGYHNAMNPGAS